ncbi:phycobilisome linker polypeptide [Leptothoe kymatousa]|uniref:Rod-capping linker protein n=1 Tax=Leptothoe kymatousa TAU-MAC 1615 TaxID=2364775 RepID=A0ABS5Y1C1_9CYAN|nr:phycobilisome linker polypeptide [Leptothoe kymatousa]MBT9311616.1 rod-capping linker protein [Leptothoe kymatousa TAU-MAC 1615]
MAGMITTGCAGVSDYGSRSVTIDVANVARQDVAKTSNYQVKVPFSQMSQTMRNIAELGGNVVGVSVSGAAPASTGSSDD